MAAAPPPSQATLPAVAFPATASPNETQERRRNRALVFVALMVLGSTLAGVLLAVVRPWESNPPAKVEATSKKSESESEAGKQPAAEPSEAPKPPPSENPKPVDSKPADPKPGAAAAKVPAATTSAAAKPSVVPTAAPASNCNPPFTIDSDGIRHPKPECM